LADGLAVKNTNLNASAVLFRRPSLAVVEKTLRKFKVSGDWCLYGRIIDGGYVAHSPGKLNDHRRHGQSVIAEHGNKDVGLAEMGKSHGLLLERCGLGEPLIAKMVAHAYEIWKQRSPKSGEGELWVAYGLDLPATMRQRLVQLTRSRAERARARRGASQALDR